MTAVAHLSWPSTVSSRGSEWLTLGREPDGSWWFAARYAGRWPIGGGTTRVAACAQWLLDPPPPGRYEKEFLLLDRQVGTRRPEPDQRSSNCPPEQSWTVRPSGGGAPTVIGSAYVLDPPDGARKV